MVSATIMKSYYLFLSDPEKSHCEKMKGNLFKINKLHVTVTFTVGFLSALLTPFLCILPCVQRPFHLPRS